MLDWIFRLPPLSTLGMAVLGCVPCAVNFYTLQLRGEPFLPWDLAQVSEAAGVASAAGIKIQTSMIVTVVVELALMAGSFFLYRGRHKQRWLPRVAGSAATAAALCLLIFGVYLQPAVCQAVGIVADPWMQDRYYRYYGVVTGFMTNLSNLEIDKPDNYSEETVDAILDNVDESRKFSTSPLYPTSYAAKKAYHYLCDERVLLGCVGAGTVRHQVRHGCVGQLARPAADQRLWPGLQPQLWRWHL